jgi:hypothetical protein
MIIKRRSVWLRIFEKEGNRLYVIAQFYPRMAVYNDVEGWQNMQFWEVEICFSFGDFDVILLFLLTTLWKRQVS